MAKRKKLDHLTPVTLEDGNLPPQPDLLALVRAGLTLADNKLPDPEAVMHVRFLIVRELHQRHDKLIYDIMYQLLEDNAMAIARADGSDTFQGKHLLQAAALFPYDPADLVRMYKRWKKRRAKRVAK